MLPPEQVLQRYNARKPLPAYSQAWFDQELQNIQRAIARTEGLYPGGLDFDPTTYRANRHLPTIRDYGAQGDGASHPLSDYYASLAHAQVKYPFATSLADEMDWAGYQLAIDSLPVGGGILLAPSTGQAGFYRIPKPVIWKSGLTVLGTGVTNCEFKNFGDDDCIYASPTRGTRGLRGADFLITDARGTGGIPARTKGNNIHFDAQGDQAVYQLNRLILNGHKHNIRVGVSVTSSIEDVRGNSAATSFFGHYGLGTSTRIASCYASGCNFIYASGGLGYSSLINPACDSPPGIAYHFDAVDPVTGLYNPMGGYYSGFVLFDAPGCEGPSMETMVFLDGLGYAIQAPRFGPTPAGIHAVMEFVGTAHVHVAGGQLDGADYSVSAISSPFQTAEEITLDNTQLHTPAINALYNPEGAIHHRRGRKFNVGGT